jgi:hypothetical protein
MKNALTITFFYLTTLTILGEENKL